MNFSGPFNVALVQMAMTPDAADNLARATERIREAAAAGARVVCLPELFRTPYFCQSEDTVFFDLAEPVPGPTVQALSSLAAQTRTVLIAPLFERRAAGLYHNTVVVLDSDGSLAGIYRKMHIPDDPAFYEKFYFTPGDLGFRAINTSIGRIGVLICWDQWFPEAARLLALQGVGIVFYPTAIGWHPREKAAFGARQLAAWRTVQRGHAIANGFYIAAINRVGLERPAAGGDGIEFWGSSFLSDPQGVVLAEASAAREEIVYGQVDVAHLETIRRLWPFLRDRRVDAYDGITEQFLDHTPGK